MLLKFEYQPFGRASPEGASAGQAQPALPAAHRSAGQGPMYTVGVQDMAINYLQMPSVTVPMGNGETTEINKSVG